MTKMSHQWIWLTLQGWYFGIIITFRLVDLKVTEYSKIPLQKVSENKFWLTRFFLNKKFSIHHKFPTKSSFWSRWKEQNSSKVYTKELGYHHVHISILKTLLGDYDPMLFWFLQKDANTRNYCKFVGTQNLKWYPFLITGWCKRENDPALMVGQFEGLFQMDLCTADHWWRC